MNLRQVKHRLINFSYKKICIALLLVYTFSCGSDLNYAIYMNMSLFEYILYTLTDHYYLIYAWLFFLIFLTARQVNEKNSLERLRFGTIRKFYHFNNLTKAIQLTCLIFIHAFIPFVIGITKLEFNNTFNSMLPEGVFDSNLDVITAYADCFDSPISSIICVLTYWIVGSVFISEVIYYCSEIWQKKGMLIGIFLVLISTMTGFMTEIDEHIFEFFFFNNYYILHHVLLNIGIIPMVINLFIMAAGIIFLEKIALSKNCNKCHKEKSVSKVLFGVKPITCILFFTLLVILRIIGENETYSIIWKLVKGFSFQGFQLTEFLYYIAPALFVFFFINAAWEKESKGRNELAEIRFGSRKKWNKIMEKSCIKFITKSYFIYLALITVVSFICTLIFGWNSDEWVQEIIEYYGINKDTILYSFFIALLIRILELYLLYSIDRFIYILINNSIASYIIIFIMYIPGILFENMNLFIFGKGSAYQVIELFSLGRELTIPIIIILNLIGILTLNFINQNRYLINRKENLCQK